MNHCSAIVPAVAGLLLTVLVTAGARAADTGSQPTPSVGPRALEFFERTIRPTLAEHCFKCHSAQAERSKKLKAGLLLDSRAGLLTGGDSGPAIVPGKAADSLLIKSLHYDGDVKMPPKGKLPERVIADFVKWIDQGAIAPTQAVQSAPRKQVGMSLRDGRNFWSYRLPVRGPLPPVQATAWPVENLDRFILATLEAKHLQPATEADRATLVRRLYFDLIGLPPTPDEVDAFVTDEASDAYAKLVDKLLTMPEFGERWGRHWLDIARYAESVTLRGFIFKQGWRYRDYVIESFNNDVSFDQFVREQIAGDLLPGRTLEERRRQLVATTFLALSNSNLEEQDKQQLRMDVVDEQLDVITKGFLAQTVTCARCHDHKFDPIPTKDYYALAGILRNSKALEHDNVSKWLEVPLPVDPAEEAVFNQHETAVATLQAKIASEKAKHPTVTKAARGILALKDVEGIVVDDLGAEKVGAWRTSQSIPTYIGSGYADDQNVGKGEKTLTFHPEALPPGKYEVRLAYVPGNNRAEAVPVTVFSADGEKTISVDMKKTPPLDSRFVSLGTYRFEKNGIGYVIVSNEGTKGHVTPDAVVFLSLDQPRPSEKPKGADTIDSLRSLQAELKHLQDSGPIRPKVMTVVEEKQIEDTRVHLRGLVHNLGDKVPRGFLQVATYDTPPTIPEKQSGRKELAEWIASRSNPLTARVIVNRTWHWLFGTGLVRTTDNFGTTGEQPSHPELLDALAVTFMDEGWSMKNLIRHIVSSRTYRQSSSGQAMTVAADPGNRWFGRANRRRLDAECIRDTMLAVSGDLSHERGGPSFPPNLAADYSYKSNSTRRTVYLPMFRNSLPELLEVFDAADPSTVTGQRNVSTVAPQALFMMNHPFVLDQAKRAAGRVLLMTKLADDDARLTQVYRVTLGREPTAAERQVATRYLHAHTDDPAATWTDLCHALFASADFRTLN